MRQKWTKVPFQGRNSYRELGEESVVELLVAGRFTLSEQGLFSGHSLLRWLTDWLTDSARIRKSNSRALSQLFNAEKTEEVCKWIQRHRVGEQMDLLQPNIRLSSHTFTFLRVYLSSVPPTPCVFVYWFDCGMVRCGALSMTVLTNSPIIHNSGLN